MIKVEWHLHTNRIELKMMLKLAIGRGCPSIARCRGQHRCRSRHPWSPSVYGLGLVAVFGELSLANETENVSEGHVRLQLFEGRQPTRYRTVAPDCYWPTSASVIGQPLRG